MLRIFSAIVLLSLPAHVHAQALYNNGATINIAANTPVYVVGDLTNDATSTINNNGMLNVSGNTTNNGTITSAGSSNLVLAGTTAQTLSGTSPISAKNVTVSNSAGVTLSTSLTVDGIMSFTSGILTATTSTAPVIFTANSSINSSATPSDASHIDGYVRYLGTGAFTFPVGNATKYQPVGVNLSANSSGMTTRYYAADAGSATFGTSGSSSTPLLYYSKGEYWDLIPQSTATGTVTVYFDNYKNAGIGNISDLRVAHKSAGQWLNEGGTAAGITTSGSVTSNSISTFSPFTLGSVSASSPLPVKLMSFNVSIEGARNRVDWQTAAEDAGTDFVVERSANAITFIPSGTVASKGTNSAYTFFDDAPSVPVTYYRLRVMGSDSNPTYSNTVAVHRIMAVGSVNISPVPAAGIVTITTTDVAMAGQEAGIYDIQGRLVAMIRLSSQQSHVDLSLWNAGVYLLKLPTGNMVRFIKL